MFKRYLKFVYNIYLDCMPVIAVGVAVILGALLILLIVGALTVPMYWLSRVFIIMIILFVGAPLCFALMRWGWENM